MILVRDESTSMKICQKCQTVKIPIIMLVLVEVLSQSERPIKCFVGQGINREDWRAETCPSYSSYCVTATLCM